MASAIIDAGPAKDNFGRRGPLSVATPDLTIFSEDDRRFSIDESTIPGAGRGLFAEEPLAEGDRLEVIGALIRADRPADACTAYADRHKFRVGEFLLIPLGYGGLVNYSDPPNMRKVIEGHRVYLQALRPIARGEELFFIYDNGPPPWKGEKSS
jgi:hypothetical protein